MPVIKNVQDLTDHGNRRGRRLVLDIVEHAMAAVDTYAAARQAIRIEGNELIVEPRRYDLNKLGRVWVVGAGKGSYPAARAVEDVLGDRVAGGILAVKFDETRRLDRVKVVVAGHPVPDDNSVAVAQEIAAIAEKAQAGDLVFACITGGSSAMMVLPAPGLTLQDVKDTNRLLLRSGATIGEMNAVRKHLSMVGGGRLIRLIHPAEAITLTLLTAPENLPWPDASLPDPSTFADAITVMRHYDIWEETPAAVREYLERGLRDPSMETPKDFEGIANRIVDLGNKDRLCQAAARRAEELGLHGVVLATHIEGESREVAIALSGIAKEIHRFNRPFPKPCALICGGETTVTIRGEAGEGGPNQEFVLSFANAVSGLANMVVAAIGTDGTDGPTTYAGGIADGQTGERASELGMDLFDVVKRHDSSTALKQLGDTIYTGATGTNIVDFRVILIDTPDVPASGR